MRALVDVGHGCNNRCTFCSVAPTRESEASTEALARKIDRAAALGHTMVVLTGGEPTIRRDLPRLAKRVAARGMDLGLVTNARMLAYPKLADLLADRRLTWVHASVHGGTPEVHDAIVGDAAFEQTLAGVRTCLARGVAVHLHCVVTRANLHHLRGVVDLLSDLPGGTLAFAPVEPVGDAARDDSQVPSPEEAARAIADAIRHGDSREHRSGVRTAGLRGISEWIGQARSAGAASRAMPSGMAQRSRQAEAPEIAGSPTGARSFGAPGLSGRVAHQDVPLCLLPGLEDRWTDPRARGFTRRSRVADDDLLPLDRGGRVQPEPCTDCALRGRCPGLHEATLETFGAGMLTPKLAHRSNSYNFVPGGSATWEAGAPCPLLDRGPHVLDRTRDVFLRQGETMTRYETATRDFAEAELRATKHVHGQVYVDITDKTAPDDFAADLRKLVRVPECAPCPARDACPNCYEALDEDVFTRDDALLRDLIAGLEGDVLDVGCGDGRYGDVLGPLVESGRIRYRGLDPHAPTVESLRERWPWATLEVGRAEDLDLPPESLDHALVLRSWNHLERPRDVLTVLTKALRPGGTLLVADNVAFGLLRSPTQASRAETGPSELEHFRNHSATQARALLEALPLTVEAFHEVGPRTSNQWVLHARRTG
ncbi:MAG: radical SAM protein [Myxococcota bacterium]